ncbi:hypothetical protein ACTORG_13065 [Pseudomonas guariconensis]|uniref:hypothetical protein n=1 Tax=Pseudomonas guariconensis TaxID=1288410 RepID=UPI003F919564
MSNKHPNASSPSEKLLGPSVKIAKKIATQIMRFKKMSDKELLAHFNGNRFSSLCSLKTPAVELFYGRDGSRFFLDLARILILYAPELKQKINLDKVVVAVKNSYSNQFIIDGKPIEKETIKDMFDSAIKDIKSGFKKCMHYIPCVLFIHPSPDDFSVGPVKFVRTSALLSQTFPMEWHSQGDDISLEQRSLNYYKEYPWVACVEVESCDFDVSFEVAVFACTTALNAIRVCFGSDATKLIRLSTEASGELRSARVWASPDGKFECSHSSISKSPYGPLNWYEYLNEQDGGRIKSFLGDVIHQVCALDNFSELSGRLIDAVNWFGDACLERSPAASIVKYVTAIERLYMASKDFGVKERFINRVSKILSDFELSASDIARQDALKVYNLRSTLVHGGTSPRAGEEILPKAEAEQLARGCILCSEQLYRVIFNTFDPKTPAELEEAMKTYETEGLQWCIDKAEQRHRRA